jgi:hypothetical protein
MKLTEDSDVLNASQDNPLVKTPVVFIEWITPQVERAGRAKELRDRWDREASASRADVGLPRSLAWPRLLPGRGVSTVPRQSRSKQPSGLAESLRA